jgi:serine/threonine protein kinase
MKHLYQIGDAPKTGLVVRNILEGGMGVIYVLQHEQQTEPSIVFKSFDSSLFMSEKTLARFQRESLIWFMLLPHPNIVNVASFEMNGGMPYLIMEYLPGGNLRERMRSGSMDLQSGLRIALQFCEGMIFLQGSGGIVHRDIKPENILFSKEDVLKISDLGLASALATAAIEEVKESAVDKASSDSMLTQAGAIMGTLPYMAPEQFDEFHTLTVSADVYAFGVVLYEMLAGQHPFDAISVREMAHAHRKLTPPPLATHQPGIPAEIEAVVMQCLAKKPQDRFASFNELSDALQTFCHKNGLQHLIPERITRSDLEAKLDSSDWSNRGYAFKQLGKLTESLASYYKGIELAKKERQANPNEPGSDTMAMLYNNLGVALGIADKTAESKAAFQDALKEKPDFSAALFHLAEHAFLEGKTEEGLAIFRKTFAADDSADFKLKYIRKCYELDRKDEFEEHFSSILNSGKLSASQLLHLGCSYDDMYMDFQVALRCFDHMIKIQPDYASAWYNKGVAHHRAENREEAVKCYKKTLELDHDHSLARCYLGIILWRSGNLKEASWQLNKFLASASDSPIRTILLSIIQLQEMGMPADMLLEKLDRPLGIKHSL